MPKGRAIYDLYWLRTALGLTQRQCASACGLSYGMYGRLETGKSEATTATLRKLAKGLHTSQRRLTEGGQR